MTPVMPCHSRVQENQVRTFNLQMTLVRKFFDKQSLFCIFDPSQSEFLSISIESMALVRWSPRCKKAPRRIGETYRPGTTAPRPQWAHLKTKRSASRNNPEGN